MLGGSSRKTILNEVFDCIQLILGGGSIFLIWFVFLKWRPELLIASGDGVLFDLPYLHLIKKLIQSESSSFYIPGLTFAFHPAWAWRIANGFWLLPGVLCFLSVFTLLTLCFPVLLGIAFSKTEKNRKSVFLLVLATFFISVLFALPEFSLILNHIFALALFPWKKFKPTGGGLSLGFVLILVLFLNLTPVFSLAAVLSQTKLAEQCLLVLSMNFHGSMLVVENASRSTPVFPVYGALTGVLVSENSSKVQIGFGHVK